MTPILRLDIYISLQTKRSMHDEIAGCDSLERRQTMTKPLAFTSLFDIWDVPSVYVASSGLFVPGLLMTARMQAIPITPTPTAPSPFPSRPHP
jgi:hypothetical protein